MKTWDHHRSDSAYQRFNRWLAIKITTAVGTMTCAYVFALLALVSFPAALNGGTSALIQWIAQTFLQLVLLSVIIVGQNVQSLASDARAIKSLEDIEKIIDSLDLTTPGGLEAVMTAIKEHQ